MGFVVPDTPVAHPEIHKSLVIQFASSVPDPLTFEAVPSNVANISISVLLLGFACEILNAKPSWFVVINVKFVFTLALPETPNLMMPSAFEPLKQPFKKIKSVPTNVPAGILYNPIFVSDPAAACPEKVYLF